MRNISAKRMNKAGLTLMTKVLLRDKAHGHYPISSGGPHSSLVKFLSESFYAKTEGKSIIYCQRKDKTDLSIGAFIIEYEMRSSSPQRHEGDK
jgi:hypothetical protein